MPAAAPPKSRTSAEHKTRTSCLSAALAVVCGGHINSKLHFIYRKPKTYLESLSFGNKGEKQG